MILNSSNTLLYIEPTGQKPKAAFIDSYTRKMTFAYQRPLSMGVLDRDGTFSKNHSTMGFQKCSYGVTSGPIDYELANNVITNSLCIHYLAWHRNEVPQSELDKSKYVI